jgi:hypothetical protein
MYNNGREQLQFHESMRKLECISIYIDKKLSASSDEQQRMYIKVFREYLVQLGVNVPVLGVKRWDNANVVLNKLPNNGILNNKALRAVNWFPGYQKLCFKDKLIKHGIKQYGQNVLF